jgi:hypothetical protein
VIRRFKGCENDDICMAAAGFIFLTQKYQNTKKRGVVE